MNANNQITTTGFSYDAAANETSDVTSTYVWNAESELKTAASVNYTYDGDGDRVEKSNGKIYWYGAGSEILDESDLSGNITDEYIFFGGKRIARRDSSNNVVYYVDDLLGSSRVVTNATGGILDQSDFYPYGGEHVLTSSSGNTYKFEGKERDAETNNDNFGARYYSSTYGRFLSADWSAVPEPVPYANLTNPQTLNLYAMVSDNPETFADLDGHCYVMSLGTCSPSGISADASPPGDTASADCAFDALACYQGPAANPSNAKPPKDPGKKGECRDGWCWDEKTNEWRKQKPIGAAVAGAALAELACVFAEPCGAVQTFVAGAALITVGVAKLYQNLTFSRGGKQNILPTWAEGERPLPGESARDFATRVCDKHYGIGNYDTGPTSDHSQIKKWARDKFEI